MAMANFFSSLYHKDESLEMFCLIWFDSNSNKDENTEHKLHSIINHLKTFRDLDQCRQFLQRTSAKDRLILIDNE